jgi:hypothetical protein
MVFGMAFLPSVVLAADAPEPEKLARLVKDYAFSTNSNLNINTQFKISELKVPGLAERLGVGLFDVKCGIAGNRDGRGGESGERARGCVRPWECRARL